MQDFQNQHFIVTGASSGFGEAITRRLCGEKALVTGVARGKEKLESLESELQDLFISLPGDLMDPATLAEIEKRALKVGLSGLILNSGGPPIGTAADTTPDEWDDAYRLVFRWKVDLVKRLLPLLEKQGYGRILFIESQSIKQPISDLVQSNAMRAAVAGYAKTLSLEVAKYGITVNIIAPGPHYTPAIERVVDSKARDSGKSREETIKEMEAAIPVGRMGKGEELASLARWILSSDASFVTGQVFSHDGGSVRHITG